VELGRHRPSPPCSARGQPKGAAAKPSAPRITLKIPLTAARLIWRDMHERGGGVPNLLTHPITGDRRLRSSRWTSRGTPPPTPRAKPQAKQQAQHPPLPSLPRVGFARRAWHAMLHHRDGVAVPQRTHAYHHRAPTRTPSRMSEKGNQINSCVYNVPREPLSQLNERSQRPSRSLVGRSRIMTDADAAPSSGVLCCARAPSRPVGSRRCKSPPSLAAPKPQTGQRRTRLR
jgi:hypothetical protein